MSERDFRLRADELKIKCDAMEKSIRDSREDYQKIKDAQKDAERIAEKVKACEDELKSKESELKMKKDRIENMKKFAASGPAGSEANVKNLESSLEHEKKNLAELEKSITEAQKKSEVNAEILRSLGHSSASRGADVGLILSPLSTNHVLEGRFRVDEIHSRSPLASKNVQVGDILMAVDGEDVCGMSLVSVQASLKGREETTVKLEFYRENGSAFLKLPYTVQRFVA